MLLFVLDTHGLINDKLKIIYFTVSTYIDNIQVKIVMIEVTSGESASAGLAVQKSYNKISGQGPGTLKAILLRHVAVCADIMGPGLNEIRRMAAVVITGRHYQPHPFGFWIGGMKDRGPVR